MAILDTDANEIVIRVVYDGPPEAGKTTSMRALGASLAQSTVTPEEDAAGRTLWFDWMEYVGGRFEGSRIRCQIVSVPGQRELRQRRKLLLQTADVVVFVGDSTPARWDLSIEYLFELRRMLSGSSDSQSPPIGVVFQANKRDTPGAIDLDGLRLRLGDARWSIGVVESVAADGTGIREAFVYAVRLALDRVRELMTQGRLPQGPPELTSPAQLLAQLQADNEPRARGTGPIEVPRKPRVRVASAPDSLAAALLREVLAAEETFDAASAASSPRNAPRPPDASVPSGAIWPPVEGRAILYEVSQLALTSRVLGNGDWTAGLGSGWRIVSAQDAVFDSLDAGRSALIQWARLHAACAAAVSPRRCIVLASTGEGRWRLWQIVRAEPPLREYASAASREPTPDLAVYRLCQTAQLLVDLHERLAEMPCELPCSLDTVGQTETQAVYIGLMPNNAAPLSTRIDAPALLAAELGPVVDLDLAGQRMDLGLALERIPRRFSHADTVVASLATLLA
jgi:signal recognition particle receptor subunit beta